MSDGSNWALILHGGLRTIAPEDAAANRSGRLLAARLDSKLLAGGGSGRIGCARTSEHFAVAMAARDQPPFAILHQDELDPYRG